MVPEQEEDTMMPVTEPELLKLVNEISPELTAAKGPEKKSLLSEIEFYKVGCAR